MKPNNKNRQAIPTAYGTGLIALDAVVNENSTEPIRYYTGGTCGNVLLALTFLGWSSGPIARLGSDSAADSIVSDLKHWKAKLQYLHQDDGDGTPIIIHKISRNRSGQSVHSFSWRCPICGNRFPPYKPVLASTAEAVSKRIKKVDVFFFDRVSRGALILARACEENGAVVVFEPISVGNPILFREACQIAHVVKYSHERMSESPTELDESKSVRLHIETQGEHGLRYRTRKPGKSFGAWNTSEALSIENVRDSAGAGDWCTAGIISQIACRGLAGLDKCNGDEIRKAVQYGQALAAWTCTFDGARGGMYATSRTAFAAQIKRILQGEESRGRMILPLQKKFDSAFASICASCKPAKGREKHKSKRRSG